MKKIAAEKNYRIFKRADTGDDIFDLQTRVESLEHMRDGDKELIDGINDTMVQLHQDVGNLKQIWNAFNSLVERVQSLEDRQ